MGEDEDGDGISAVNGKKNSNLFNFFAIGYALIVYICK